MKGDYFKMAKKIPKKKKQNKKKKEQFCVSASFCGQINAFGTSGHSDLLYLK